MFRLFSVVCKVFSLRPGSTVHCIFGFPLHRALVKALVCLKRKRERRKLERERQTCSRKTLRNRTPNAKTPNAKRFKRRFKHTKVKALAKNLVNNLVNNSSDRLTEHFSKNNSKTSPKLLPKTQKLQTNKSVMKFAPTNKKRGDGKVFKAFL